MSKKLILKDGHRYRVRGKGPIVSPTLRWDASRCVFYSRTVAYSVDVVEWVQPVEHSLKSEFVSIHECGMRPSRARAVVQSFSDLADIVLGLIVDSPRCPRSYLLRTTGVTTEVLTIAMRELVDQRKIRRQGGVWVATAAAREAAYAGQ